MQLTVGHLDDIRPRGMDSIGHPVVFATLNGCATLPKGARLIVDALRQLKAWGLSGRFRLLVCGGLADSVRNELLDFGNVTYSGWYQVGQLDRMLENVHVGVIPSIWEEAYGFVGMEFLAKGVPVIGNAMGGIVDYTTEGVTGWINRTNSAEGLAAIMSRIIHDPQQILTLNRSIVARRGQLLKSMKDHAAEMHDVYRSIQGRGRTQ